jgi:hypothetical protein
VFDTIEIVFECITFRTNLFVNFFANFIECIRVEYGQVSDPRGWEGCRCTCTFWVQKVARTLTLFVNEFGPVSTDKFRVTLYHEFPFVVIDTLESHVQWVH